MNNSYFNKYPQTNSLLEPAIRARLQQNNSTAKLEAALKRQMEEAEALRRRKEAEAEALRRQMLAQQQQRQQQQGGGINPRQAYNMYNKFAGGSTGGGAGMTGGTAAQISSGSTLGGGTPFVPAQTSAITGAVPATPGLGGAGAAGGASGFGSTAAAAAPWAGLAAAIIANESKQRGDGNRGNSGWEHAGDLLTGKTLERDMQRYMPDNKVGSAATRLAMMATPSGIVRNTKDFGDWAKGLFD